MFSWRIMSTRRRIGSSRAARGLLVAGAAGLVLLGASPASAQGTGQERIVAPVDHFIPATDANGNPIDSSITLTGTGFTPGATVFAMICDGSNPTSSDWAATTDCDLQTTASVTASASGAIDFDPAVPGETIDVFRGVGPGDVFNCIAPIDDPNSTMAEVPNAADPADVAHIDPAIPSWGGDSVGLNNGGFSPCTIRVAYEQDTYEPADQFVSIDLAQDGTPAAPSVVPEVPWAWALPAGAAVLFVGAGMVLYRRRPA
jgi:hypothetical protein